MKLIPSRPVFSALALSLFSSFAFSQSVTNGTFQGPDYTTAGYDAISGWTATGGIATATVQDQDWNGVLTAPPGGTKQSEVVVAWSVTQSAPTLSQTIAGLTVGDTYTISFDDAVANRAATPYPGTFDWGVQFGTQTQTGSAVTIPDPYAASAWVHNSLTFTATATSQVLEFLAQSSVGVAPEPALFLDNVSISGAAVAAVPEPGTYALMLAGLGAMGWVARRRRAA